VSSCDWLCSYKYYNMSGNTYHLHHLRDSLKSVNIAKHTSYKATNITYQGMSATNRLTSGGYLKATYLGRKDSLRKRFNYQYYNQSEVQSIILRNPESIKSINREISRRVKIASPWQSSEVIPFTCDDIVLLRLFQKS
jgi:hypothetical protein